MELVEKLMQIALDVRQTKGLTKHMACFFSNNVNMLVPG